MNRGKEIPTLRGMREKHGARNDRKGRIADKEIPTLRGMREKHGARNDATLYAGKNNSNTDNDVDF